MTESAPHRQLLLRAQLLTRIRAHFAARDALEVQTRVITRCGVTDVHLASLALEDGRYLRTSPEFAHKRLLASGLGDLYELGPVFRAGEHGRVHREEFTMLEWYRLGWSWRRLAEEVLELVQSALAQPRPVQWSSWRQLARQSLGFDPLTEHSARETVLADAPTGMDLPEQLDWLFSLQIQPQLPQTGAVVVYDFPACQAALARLKPGDPVVAERFEVFVDRIELANGYQELSDPAEQRERFDRDNLRRSRLGLPPMPVDEALLAALERGLPDCAGVALGFDRLLMLVAGADSLDAVDACSDDAETPGSDTGR
jgi:lysyl-tRNA synthetase class 2